MIKKIDILKKRLKEKQNSVKNLGVNPIKGWLFDIMSKEGSDGQTQKPLKWINYTFNGMSIWEVQSDFKEKIFGLFNINRSLKSYIWRRNNVQSQVLDLAGISVELKNDITRYIGSQFFSETEDLLTNLDKLVKANFTGVNLTVYKFLDGSNMKYIGGDIKRKSIIDLTKSEEFPSIIFEFGGDEFISILIYPHEIFGYICYLKLALPWGETLLLEFRQINRDEKTRKKYPKNKFDLEIFHVKHVLQCSSLHYLLQSRILIIYYNYIDSLTGVYNKKYLAEVASEKSYSIIRIDLDDFKQFNDEFGHQIGDEVLIELGTSLRKLVKTGDKVCRYGGDEFVVLLRTNGDRDIVNKVESRIKSYLEELNLNSDLIKKIRDLEGGENFIISATMGSQTNDPSINFWQLLAQSDKKMIDNKQSQGELYRISSKMKNFNNSQIVRVMDDLLRDRGNEKLLNELLVCLNSYKKSMNLK